MLSNFVLCIFCLVCGALGQRADEICTVGGKEGNCKNFKDCQVALTEFQRHNVRPQLCATNRRKVCCPKNSAISDEPCNVKQISCRKCQEYSDAIYKPINAQCHHTAVQLVRNGEKAVKGEFPHSALIGYERSTSDYEYLCGGSLISERWVISAAHCSFSRDFGKAKYVKLGDVVRGQNNNMTFNYDIVQRINHPSYSSVSIDHDIAIFKLDKDVKFSSYVAPICLPHFNKNPSKLIAIGYGLLSFGENLSKFLMKVKLEMFNQEQCQEKYAKTKKVKQGIDYDSKFCAGSFNDTSDTCQGDSGGAIQVYNGNDVKCMYTIIGLTSFGHVFCGQPGVPGVYTRVFHYLKWIENIVWPEL